MRLVDHLKKAKYLILDFGEGCTATVDVKMIRDKVNKRIIELGYMTQEEIDKEDNPCGTT